MIEQVTYEAGVCNVDLVGTRLRKRIGYVCLGVGVVAAVLLFVFHVEPIFRFIAIAGFAAGASLNLLQAQEHFCIANAMQGTFEIDMKRTKIGRNPVQEKLDKKKMQTIIAKTALIAIVAGTFGLLPL